MNRDLIYRYTMPLTLLANWGRGRIYQELIPANLRPRVTITLHEDPGFKALVIREIRALGEMGRGK